MEKQLKATTVFRELEENMDFKYNLEFTDDCKMKYLKSMNISPQNLASTEAAKINEKIKDVNNAFI